MKKFLLLVLLVVVGFQSQSQILISLLLGDKLNSDKLEFGVDGGLTLSNLNGTNGKFLPTVNLGFYFDFKLKNPSWIINTGLQVKSNLGASELPVYNLANNELDTIFANGNVSRKIGYFNLPIMIKYTFKNHFYLEGGFQGALRTKANDIFYSSINNEDDIQYSRNLKNNLTRLDFGTTIGIGYRLIRGNGMNLSVRYYQGFVNIVKDQAMPSEQNSAYYLNVGIPIGKSSK
jgi:hypothetical protein